jgi:hypothetical protein
MMAARWIALVLASAVAAAGCGDAPTSAARADDAAPRMHHVTSSITGPNPVPCSGMHDYDSNPGGGGSYTYAWYYRPNSDPNWYFLASTRVASQWIDVADTTMTFRVDVTSGGHTSTSYKTVTGPYTTNQVC